MRAHLLRLLIPACLLLCSALPAPAQDHRIDECTLVDHGIYDVAFTGGTNIDSGGQSQEAFTTANETLKESTERIPIGENVTLGMEYVIHGAPDGAPVPLDLAFVYPDGSVMRGVDTANIGVQKLSFVTQHYVTLDEGWYTFQVSSQGRLLVEQAFYLYLP